MRSQQDTEETTVTLRGFQFAWYKVIDDYERREINSEHCLQSSLYRHLKNILPNDFKVYVEAEVLLGESAKGETNKSKVVVDVLVCHNDVIILGVEIKYLPRGKPKMATIQKDLTSLAHITSRKHLKDRVNIEMPRFHSNDENTLVLKVAPERKLVFAAFCMDDELRKEDFWANYVPKTGYWKDNKSFPPNFCVALANTKDDGKAVHDFFGPAFNRLNASHNIE